MSLVDWNEKLIIHESILQEDEISTYDYNPKKSLLFTSSNRGTIIMTQIMLDGTVKIKEVIEKNKSIISMKINNEGTLMIFRTIENRYYMYSITDDF